MTCPEPIDSRSEERKAARGCLIGLALCVLAAAFTVAVIAWMGWYLEALSALGILLVIAALRSERRPEELGRVSGERVERHRP